MLRRTLLSLVVLVGGMSVARADEHLDDLAMQAEGISQQLLREFVGHYRGTPFFRHLMADGREVARLAQHIHMLAHHGAACQNQSHLLSDVRQLDDLYHHLEVTLENVRAHSGRFTCDHRVQRLMAALHNTVEHLESDLSELDNGSGFDNDNYGDDDYNSGYRGYTQPGFGQPRFVQPAPQAVIPTRPGLGFRFTFGN